MKARSFSLCCSAGLNGFMTIASTATLSLLLGLLLLLGCKAQTGPFCEQLCLSAGGSNSVG